MKFHFKDKVKVVSSFFKGQTGTVVNYRKRGIFKKVYSIEVYLDHSPGYSVSSYQCFTENCLELLKRGGK